MSLRLPRDWRRSRLQDLVFFQRGFDITQAQQAPGPYPVISSSGITSYHEEFKAAGPGVVIGRKGTLGSVHFSDGDYWPHDTTLWSKDLKKNNPRFVYYYLRTVDLRRFDVGNSNPTLNRNHIHDLPVLIPPENVQSRIAEILGAYDSLIENNRRRIELLVEAARQLYREWFVCLRFPGREHSELVSSELGPISQKWRTVRLGEVTTKIGSGATPRGGESAYQPEGIALIRSQNVYDERFEDDGLAYLDEKQASDLAHVAVEAEDILLNITGASVARCCMVPERHLPARVNQHVMIIRADPLKVDPYFLLASINSDQRKQQLLSYARTGGTREALTKATIESFEVVLPDETLLRQFSEIARGLGRQRETLAHANAKLCAARDLLLPRLMSGEISV